MHTYTHKRTLIFQLPHGADLLKGTTELVQRENIRLGRIQAIGATTHAVVAFYDQTLRSFLPLEFPGGLEILSCLGNVSMRDGKPFVHIHLVLSDRDGRAFGGHLLEGTRLFASEMVIDEYEGDELNRTFDETTGLHLWNCPYNL